MNRRFVLLLTAISGAAAVLLGAAGAHLLARKISPEGLDIFEKANSYHFYHTLALLAVGLTFKTKYSIWVKACIYCFVSGMILFSGSLYLLPLRDIVHQPELNILGPVTPFGGLLLMAGWVCLAVFAVFSEKEH